MSSSPRKVEFHTLDGLTLSGLFYTAGKKQPCIIMTHGLAGRKEQLLPDFAERFLEAGYAVLLYDNRNWGESDGKPRNELDPFQQARDYFQAFDYAASLPEVDETMIVYWGTSMSGGTALFAASIDKRIRGVIAQVPFASDDFLEEQRKQILPLLFSNQQNVREGAASVMINATPDSLEEATQGLSCAALPHPDVFVFLDELKRRDIIPFEKNVTLQSMLHVFNFDAKSFIHRIAPTPLLMVVADNDITVPTSLQLQAFQRALEPKKLAVIRDAGHFEVYMGRKFEENITIQIKFLEDLFS
ncbi:hypothetical protein V500_07307 [Pseudogymnoascus sp. VKM F-4518 (FW-2643)]|nr:hypothetical protein V500_07307 [Pseudogymnoascus sp. VKM F-4518 (FW-2643)]